MSKGIRITKKGNRIDMTESLRFEILNRDSFTCQYCGAKAPDVKLNVDHIIPIKKGGLTIPTNLITACEICNTGKNTRTINSDATVLKEIALADTTIEGRNKRNTTILFEIFNNGIGKLRIIQNETSRNLLQNCLNKHGFEAVKIAVEKSLTKVEYDAEMDRYTYKTIIEAFKSIPRIAGNL